MVRDSAAGQGEGHPGCIFESPTALAPSNIARHGSYPCRGRSTRGDIRTIGALDSDSVAPLCSWDGRAIMDYNWLSDCEKFHRRDVFRVGMLSMLGLTLPKYFALADKSKDGKAAAGQTSGTADSAILIWLAGGPSHLDTWDLKPDAPIEIRG